MPDEITRAEFAMLQQEVIRIDTRVDKGLADINTRLSNMQIEMVRGGATVWKYTSLSLVSFIVGVSPYVLHLAGVIK